VAARAIAQEQGTAAAPANSAVATGREQRIVAEQASSVAARIAAEQANSAAVAVGIEAALEAAAVPFKGSIVVGARRGARASAVARAGRAAAVEDLAAVVEVAAAAAAEDLAAAVEVAGGDAQVKSVEWSSPRHPTLEWNVPRHPTLDTRISFGGGRNGISKQRNGNVQVARTSRNRVRNIFDDLRPRR
jgi:hypothetical protein